MSEEKETLNFIEQIIEEDLKTTHSKQALSFRFPPSQTGICILAMHLLYVLILA